jgi:hypothetical protein
MAYDLYMPHIRFRSLSEDQVMKLSESIPQELAPAMETTEDNFSFELVPTQYYSEGRPVQSYPYTEVHWFERSQEVKQRSAKIITDKIRALTQAQDIAVVFIPIQKCDYFENGESF